MAIVNNVNKMLLVLFLAVMPEHFVVSAQAIQDGVLALKQKDYQTALRIFRPVAEHGDAEAQYNLARMYDEGLGVPKDDVEAVNWYRKAADQGLVQAQGRLGVMYRRGRGLPEDEAQAVSWFRKAADAGDGLGMANLGAMYRDGRGGLPKDDVQAVSWFQKAAEAGDGLGMDHLGAMYRDGRGGLPKDDVQAVGSVLICLFLHAMAAFSVLRIHSETFWLLAVAAVVMRFTSSALKRTGTIRPLASPFGSLGRPIFLGLVCFPIFFELLHDCGLYSGLW
jgi:TPR repeat protein